MACSRCEKLPEKQFETGTLYVAPPEQGTLVHIRTAVQNAGLRHAPFGQNILEVQVQEGTAVTLAAAFAEELTRNQLADTKSLFLPPGQTLGLDALFQMRPLTEFVGKTKSGWLLDLLRETRLVSFFQPIVECHDPQTVFAYESLLRGRGSDGAFIPPGQIFSAAHQMDLLFQLDRAARICAIESAARHRIEQNIFINFIPTAIYDPQFCLQTTVKCIESSGIAPENIVFEVIESESISDLAHMLRILNFYREHGYRIALDDLGAGYSSLNLLTRLQPDFIKMDMELIRDVDSDPYKARIAHSLLTLAANLGAKSIAEGVETAGEYEWLKQHGADYVQGYLFATPAETPPLPKVLPVAA